MILGCVKSNRGSGGDKCFGNPTYLSHQAGPKVGILINFPVYERVQEPPPYTYCGDHRSRRVELYEDAFIKPVSIVNCTPNWLVDTWRTIQSSYCQLDSQFSNNIVRSGSTQRRSPVSTDRHHPPRTAHLPPMRENAARSYSEIWTAPGWSTARKYFARRLSRGLSVRWIGG
ncbi:uncharacterized protein BDW47DRAFT_98012 [Aspergillus candidus]|uniref:Uncharacterized protein n=1 Tax=Aspergillus candidus TaxID=41067 RepID=A0A2I2FNI0_ASPCN|nr:hypothetical protein BDW47DRAFT_98012 [Aspergillus candidus]PLB42187.1 hypothetical protein BDW47DRAFT_98012 [Aspergillus candidus]